MRILVLFELVPARRRVKSQTTKTVMLELCLRLVPPFHFFAFDEFPMDFARQC